MSFKCVAVNPTRLIRIYPSMASIPDFTMSRDLKHNDGDHINKSIHSCSALSKGSSSDKQAQCKSSDPDILNSHTTSSNLNGSTQDCSQTTSSMKSKETVLVGESNVIAQTYVVSAKDSDHGKPEETSDFISVGSDMTASNSDDSSPHKMVTQTGGNSTEDGGFVDVDSVTTDTGSKVVHVDSAATDTGSKVVDVDSVATDTRSKVVVQVLSNVGCEVPLESERWDAMEDMVNFIKQSDKQLKNVAVVNEERPSDYCHQDNLSLKALSKGKMRRNHAMNLHIRSGNGVRLNDIAHVVKHVEHASSSQLCFLHKMLFGSYGASNNENALSQTKQNILHFSGFSFTEDSETYQNKRKCLLKVPYQMLHSLCHTLLGKGARTRNDSVEDLLKFMLKPTIPENAIEKQQLKTNQKESVELSDLEKQILAGPSPIILIKKLEDSFIKDLLLELKVDSLSKNLNEDIMTNNEKRPEHTKLTGMPEHRTQLRDVLKDIVENNKKSPEYIKVFGKSPAYITQLKKRTEDIMTNNEKSPVHTKVTGRPAYRTQLKNVPEVVLRVKKARRRIINLMHILLYGRPGSDDANRLNILEFEGFTDSEKNFKRKTEFLSKLRIDELNQMCYIFSLRVKKFKKLEKAIKFLHCLQAQELTKRYKKGKTHLQQQNKKIIVKKRMSHSEVKRKSVQQIKKLKDFEKIRRNIECAPPEELTELNDLLFLRPSDNLDIHQKILEFSSSSFRQDSPDFFSRRTLLYYMSFDIIRKIASILEITDWEDYRQPQDLAITVLQFLMDMKPSVNIRPKFKYSGPQRIGSSSVIHRPQIMRLQREESFREHISSRNQYQSSSGAPNSAYMEDFQQERCTEDSSVVIRRITESSYSFTDLKNNEPVTVSEGKSEESHSLYKLLQHPSETQLEVTIREMICANSWSSTMGELINKVFQYYPKLNLTYRIDFIKSKAIEVLHELQSSAKPYGDVM